MIRRPLEETLVKLGYVTFSPPGAWCGDISDPCEDTVKRGNDTILGISDLIAVRYLPGVESKGTDEELALACKLGIRMTIICGERDEISDAIAWANPIVGEARHEKTLQVEYAYITDGRIEVVSTVSYDPTIDVRE